MLKLTTAELKLGDVVMLPLLSSPWSTAIVKKVTVDEVTFFRPYGVSEDFSYTGGVLCYTGVEEYSVPRDNYLYEVYERKELK